MPWIFTEDKPIFKQLIDRITLYILQGVYPSGSKLPAVRDFAVTAGVNPNTMQRALSLMEESGFIFTKRGDGRYVTQDESLLRKLRNDYVKQRTSELIDSLSAISCSADEIREALENGLNGISKFDKEG